ncbi:MAG: hypothetical protein KAX28_01730 [Candidatus Marinimicrobia bacterium]|nr:hypothetical protein [Candidatus Neomarinimicrobiota bacterium]
MKILFDTTVIFSALGRKNDQDGYRYRLANKLIEKCDELGLKKYISERTKCEFEDGWKVKNLSEDRIEEEKSLLEKFSLLPYHYGDETWNKINGKPENIESLWNNEEEDKIATKLNKKLPGEKNKRDRGILLDAIMNDCKFVINENWIDFDRMYEIAKSFGIEITTTKNFLERQKLIMKGNVNTI